MVNGNDGVLVVAVANAKGGVAKTTSSIYLASAFARRTDRRALVLDADVQSSASRWRDLAEDSGGGLSGVDVEPANLSTLQRLRRRLSGAHGLVVVDAPPAGPVLEAALAAADFVIVPTSDSPLDLQQAYATMGVAPAGRASVLLAVAEPRTVAFAATVGSLDQTGTPRFDAVVRKRQEIKTAFGHDPRTTWEYALVLDELLEVVGR